jgi:UDP-N-acetylglucosamine/UDP-N-acetylgalactosamine diphosphorylase
MDPNGELVEPDGKNGIKFETFVFDALGYAKASVTMQVERAVEFSPVKNAEGQDSPESSRRDMTELYAVWIEAAGGSVERDADRHSAHAVEISPLYAEGPEELRSKLPGGLRVSSDTVLAQDRQGDD